METFTQSRAKVTNKYIPGGRNKVADALPRTIFPGDDCDAAGYSRLGKVSNTSKGPQWIQKDGKDGYQEMLKRIAEPIRVLELKELMITKEGTQWLKDDTIDKMDHKLSVTDVETENLCETDFLQTLAPIIHPKCSVNHQTVVGHVKNDHSSLFFICNSNDVPKVQENGLTMNI